MKNIVVIPARGGSKRLPNKNIRFLDGIPLLAHSILYAQSNSELIDAIYVSTDDESIRNIALEYGAQVIERPASLSGDFEPTVSALKHVVQSIAQPIENIVLLQATNPLRPKNLLREAFECYRNGNYDSLFTVSRNQQKLGRIIDHQFVPFNYEIGQRSQDLEPLYFENGLLYISNSKLILENMILSDKAYPMIVDHPFAHIDIDTQQDFDDAAYLLKKLS